MPENTSRQRATIRDVAAQAGVSISTVSHVFSGARKISEKTRDEVLRAADLLSYSPHPVARSLRKSETGIIGFVLRPRDAVPGSLRGTETFERLIGATAANVMQSGRALVLVSDTHRQHQREIAMDACLVAHPYSHDVELTRLMEKRVPVVAVDSDPDRRELPWTVHIDYETPMTILLDHLSACGARQIMLISGTEDNSWNRHTQAAYVTWSEQKRRSTQLEMLYEGEAQDGAWELTTRALKKDDSPDAIIAAASTFAAGALKATVEAGLNVPGDVQLAALTDSEYTRNANPSITGLDLNMEEVAYQAVNLIDRRLAQQAAPPRVSIDPSIIWRDSTRKRADG